MFTDRQNTHTHKSSQNNLGLICKHTYVIYKYQIIIYITYNYVCVYKYAYINIYTDNCSICIFSYSSLFKREPLPFSLLSEAGCTKTDKVYVQEEAGTGVHSSSSAIERNCWFPWQSRASSEIVFWGRQAQYLFYEKHRNRQNQNMVEMRTASR